MKYLGRPKVCCANCEQWFDSNSFSDGLWGKCRAIGAPLHMLSLEERDAASTLSDFWCCNFRLKDTAVELRLTKEMALIE